METINQADRPDEQPDPATQEAENLRAEQMVLRLAERMTYCPNCQGYDASLRSNGLTHEGTRELCTSCDPTGQVAKYWQLRRGCICLSFSGLRVVHETRGKGCQGRRWQPISRAKAATELRQVKKFQNWIGNHYAWAGRELVETLCTDNLIIVAFGEMEEGK